MPYYVSALLFYHVLNMLYYIANMSCHITAMLYYVADIFSNRLFFFLSWLLVNPCTQGLVDTGLDN